MKIDPNTNQIIQDYEVGRGPQQMVIYEDNLIVSRTYYSDNWYQTFFGTTQINLTSGNVTKTDHGEGIVCGGNVMVYQDQLYRTSLGGIVPIDQNDLSLDIAARIGKLANAQVLFDKAITVLSFNPRLRIVSIIPGIETLAPDLTDNKRGFFKSPNFLDTSFSISLSSLLIWLINLEFNFFLSL